MDYRKGGISNEPSQDKALRIGNQLSLPTICSLTSSTAVLGS